MPELKILGDINPIVWWAFKSRDDEDKTPVLYPRRLLNSYELDFVYDSHGGYEIIDGVKHEIQSGDLIFRKPGNVVRLFSPIKIIRIMFSLIYSKSVFLDDPIKISKESELYIKEIFINPQKEKTASEKVEFPIKFPPVMKTIQTNEFKNLFENTYIERCTDREQTHFLTKTYLLQIFALMYYELALKMVDKNTDYSIRTNYKKIMDVKKYIDDNIRKRFSIEELSLLAGLSSSYFTKTFKEIVKLSPIDYINKCKINQIKNLLIYSDIEIKEVCKEYGFEEQSYFFRVFKKIIGTTPSYYRKMFKTTTFINNS